MLRAVGFFGSSVALNNVFLRVATLALYTSPKPPPLPIVGPVAAACVAALVPPLLDAASVSAAASTTTPSTTSTGPLRRAAGSLRTCIVPSSRQPQLVFTFISGLRDGP